jgi:phosphoglycerate dehydrogenase-like enzyme
MASHVIVHPRFDGDWPLAADHLREVWPDDDLTFRRLDHDDDRPVGEVIDDPGDVTKLAALNVPVTEACLDAMPDLRKAAPLADSSYWPSDDLREKLRARGVEVIEHDGQGFWGQSVAECALALTINGLRRIPQKHGAIQHSTEEWEYDNDHPEPGERGIQFADDFPFVGGTVADTTVRTVGVGNIGSRYADICSSLGADVASYDPYAPEPSFHRSGTRAVRDLDALVADADVFAPLVPATDETRHLVGREQVEALPEGALVVLATRARVVDPEPLRERVLADELALAADVWDENPGEPVPTDDPLIGRENVVHTPHIAGRTRHANEEWAERLAAQF